ncbi:MAG: ThuA domain-containing protein [Thermoguttaceae bacterium]|nr:ThuA domain-containing protein [Thermoguttaceae bacterium]
MGHKIKISRRAALAVGAALTGELLLGTASRADSPKRRALVWSEGTAPKDVYPEDVNTAIAEGLRSLPDWEIATASINDPDQGVSDDALAATDVLLWWGHVRHRDVKDVLVERIVRRVKEKGMGFIAIHSSHFSKALRSLLGTRCGFSAYVCDGSSVDVIVKAKDHPIAEGVNNFTLAQTERYSEPFEVPEPEAVVFDGVYHRPDGSTEASRQGLVWTVGKGKVFYFQPGHETYPHFFDPSVRRILRNAVVWAAPAR